MRIPEASGWFSVQASSIIDAPLERVWAVLVDLEHYHAWNSFVPSMQASPFEVGSILTMGVQMNKKLRTSSIETITALEPLRLLAWETRSPAWLLRGERFQEITAFDTNRTRYWTREAFSGILAPVLKMLLGKDLQYGFNAVARDLKDRAEILHRGDVL